jgi:hypothetical protein
VLGKEGRRWVLAQRVALVVVLACVAALGWHATEVAWRAALAAVLVVPLAGVVRLNVRVFPVLVDLPAMALAAVAATALVYDLPWWTVVGVAMVAGATKESAPVFAALWAWHPLPLLGLVVPAVVRALVRPGPEVAGLEHLAVTTEQPWRASREAHAGRWLDHQLWLVPWGPALVGLWGAGPEVLVPLAVAYGQTLVATDTVRLYQWGFVPLVVAAAVVVPWAAVPVVVALVVWSGRWSGDGI